MHLRLLLPILLLLCCNPRKFNAFGDGRADGGAGNGPPADAGGPLADAGPADSGPGAPDADREPGSPDAAAPDAGSQPCGDTTSNVDACGACDRYCVGSPNAVLACVASGCVEDYLALTEPRVSATYGANDPLSGGEFARLCPEGQVMVGIYGKSDDVGVEPELGLMTVGVHCGQLALVQSEDGVRSASLEAGEKLISTTLNVDWKPADYDLPCPAGSVVTEVSGSTRKFDPSIDKLSIGHLAIVCTPLRFDTSGALRLDSPNSVTMQAGISSFNSSVLFNEPCGPGRVVTGFSGRCGAYLDALAVQCSMLSVAQREAPFLVR